MTLYPTMRVKRLDRSLPLPAYAHDTDAGLDLSVATDCEIEPGCIAFVGAGVAVRIPESCFGLVAIRSSVGRRGVTLANGVGIIDAGYTGEIKLPLLNNARETVRFERGDRVAQLLVVPVAHVTAEEVDDLGATERGDGGFGSTGRRARP